MWFMDVVRGEMLVAAVTEEGSVERTRWKLMTRCCNIEIIKVSLVDFSRYLELWQGTREKGTPKEGSKEVVLFRINEG